MMVPYNLRELGVAQARHHLAALFGVTLGDVELLIGEPTRFSEYFRRQVELADVMNRGGRSD